MLYPGPRHTKERSLLKHKHAVYSHCFSAVKVEIYIIRKNSNSNFNILLKTLIVGTAHMYCTMFWIKITKTGMHLYATFYYVILGFNGVNCSETRFPDALQV